MYSSGVFNFSGNANIINCTFYGNHTAISNQGGNLISVSNCILWGNNNSLNIISPPTTAFTVANSIVQGGWSGTGNLDTDPLFVNAAGGDFRLQACSPAINAGSNGDVPGGITTDLDGNARFYNNGTVDMGAYEFQSTPPTFVTCYQDSDNDSFGNPAMSQVFCNTCGTGYVSNSADCNDANQAINPLAAEVCDGFDNNCNSQTDEGNVCCPSGNVIYVKANATGANNGTSWNNAYTNLQSALNSTCLGITEIWVAAGTYKPTTGADRNISFVMKNGVAIYGGFPGLSGQEGNFGVRNWAANVTTLSGEIGAAGNADNSYRVINNSFNSNAPLTSSAILDGFIVEAANANGSFPLNLGGGMWNTHASPTVRNCIFRNNTATSGAAIFNDNSQANVTNCLFTGNSCSVAGAAMSNGGGTASAMVINCTFYGNTGGNSTIHNEVGATAISNCIIWGNANGVLGGTVSYSIVQGGFSGTGNLNADPLFVNAAAGDFHLQACSRAIDLGTDAGAPSNDFENNARVDALTGSNIVDAGIYEYQSIFATNRYYVNAASTVSGHGSSWSCALKDLQEALALAGNGDEIWVAAGTYKPTTGTNRNISFVMKNGVAIYGGFNGTETQLSQRNWAANVTVLSGDIGVIGYHSDNSFHVILNSQNGLNNTALLDGFTISGGDANDFYPNNSGGGMCNFASSPAVANCIFTDNWAISGGGLHNDDFSSPVLTNCRFFDNEAANAGGGIYNRLGSFPHFINCTISGNIPTEVIYWAGFPIFTNCIIWGNHNLTSLNSNVSYSIIQGGHPGTGNLNVNPLFMNATGGDLRLQACSPAVNTGSNAAVPGGFTTDLDKNPRIFGGTVDMGAYEFQTAPTPLVPVCQNQTVFLNNMGMASFSPALLSNGSTGCGTLLYTVGGQSTLNFTCADTGAPIPVTLTVTDDRGITATCSASITVV
ncbi:MAG TPA: putative metal-binding motif-containing protein, partial [Saprospiraceae bacterium]|nr:putative metal-binding motif-containing protein [Saprospiraceae bacterium]